MSKELLKPNLVKDRILSSPIPEQWQPEDVHGSFYLSVYRRAERIIDDRGDWRWLNDVLTGDSLTAIEALTYGKRFAVLLRGMGFGRGDVIHVVAGNTNLSYSAAFGVWILGGIVSVGDVNLEDRAVALQLKDTEAKVVLCTPETSDLVKRAVGLLDPNRKMTALCLGEASWCDDALELLKDADPAKCPDPYTTNDVKKDTAVIFWSSGTTGHPKGICHSHYTAFNFGGILFKILKPDENLVTTTCFFHVGGFYTGIYALMLHQFFYHMFGPNFELEHLFKTIVERRPKQIALGTHHYVQLSESALLRDADPADLDSLELILPAGAAVPQSCADKYRAKMPNLQFIINGYGQTEMGITSLGVSNDHLGTVLPGVRLKVENPTTGERCGPGEIGELCGRTTYSLMLRYLNRPKETKEYFDFEGFGHTGDMVYYDNEGAIHYVDRLKEIIKYKNNHVSPTELEDIMQRHEAVRESLAFGKPDPRVQEVITMVVALNDGFKPSDKLEKELVEHLNKEVTDYKRIRGGIIFRDSIPRNSVGKLVRFQMRKWAREQIDKK